MKKLLIIVVSLISIMAAIHLGIYIGEHQKSKTLGSANDILGRDDVRLQVVVASTTSVGGFNDAIYYDPDTLGSLTNAQIDAAKKERVENWIELVQEQSNATSSPVEPTER